MDNIPNNFSKDGAAVYPTSFSLKNISLINHKDEGIDIRQGLVGFSITESLYNSTLLIEIVFKDEYNILEDLPIIGQEKLDIEIFRKSNDPHIPEEIISLQFLVTEYPEFIRLQADRVSAFKIIGVSEHAYKSKFKKICRKTQGLTTTEIEKIYTKDLGVKKFNNIGSCMSRFKGILNINNPSYHAGWLLIKSFDEANTPYFCFQTFDGTLNLVSYSELLKEEPYYKYEDKRGFFASGQDENTYTELSKRIIDVSSDLRMAKPILAIPGAYAAKHSYLDYTKKNFSNHKYSYQNLSERLEANPTISKDFLIDGQPFDALFDAHHEYISINDWAHGKTSKNYNNLKKVSKGLVKGYVENLETTSHELTLYGDMNLNAGVIIELEFPKAISLDIEQGIDEHLSGKYIITSAIHEFKDSEYFTRVKVKRDSFLLQI